jgi:hypothetical protein
MSSDILVEDDTSLLLEIVKNHSRKTVDIPKKLFDQIQKKIQGTSFSSVEEYCVSKLTLELSRDTLYLPEYAHQIRQYLKRIAHP